MAETNSGIGPSPIKSYRQACTKPGDSKPRPFSVCRHCVARPHRWRGKFPNTHRIRCAISWIRVPGLGLAQFTEVSSLFLLNRRLNICPTPYSPCDRGCRRVFGSRQGHDERISRPMGSRRSEGVPPCGRAQYCRRPARNARDCRGLRALPVECAAGCHRKLRSRMPSESQPLRVRWPAKRSAKRSTVLARTPRRTDVGGTRRADVRVRDGTRRQRMSMRRMTMTAADQMSVGALPDAAAERRIVLTRWGQDVAVFDTAERWNETARSVKSVTE